MIPKIIHYCWFGPKPFPKIVRKCMETWRKHLPEYEFILWNEENSPMEVTFVKQAYAAKKYAFVADYVRFWALYQHGGIYLDTDMFVIRTFDNLLQSKVFLGWETADYKMLGACVIGAAPNSPFIKNVIERYLGLNFNLSSLPDFVIPKILTPIYQKFEDKEELKVLNHDYFYPFPYEEKENVANFRRYITKNTYAVHLWNVSWGSWNAKLRDSIFYHYKKLTKIING